jgi:hypothetical protein
MRNAIVDMLSGKAKYESFPDDVANDRAEYGEGTIY